MFSLSVVTWIGNAAAVLSGQWGAVSQRARDVMCSREAMDHNRAIAMLCAPHPIVKAEHLGCRAFGCGQSVKLS